jgi:hypothetical protein
VEEVVGNVGAVRGAAALEARHAELIEALAELEEEARLADAGLACDPDHLAEAVPGAVDAFEKEPQLELTAHEGAQAAPAQTEARRLRPHQVKAAVVGQD